MTTHKFSARIEKAIFAEVTRRYTSSYDSSIERLCNIMGSDCARCPYIQVLGKYCGAGEGLNENECLTRAHELIRSCGLNLSQQSPVYSPKMWNKKQEELSLFLVNKLHDWSKRTGTIFISSLKSTDVHDIVSDILENIFGESVEEQESGQFECERVDVVRLPKK